MFSTDLFTGKMFAYNRDIVLLQFQCMQTWHTTCHDHKVGGSFPISISFRSMIHIFLSVEPNNETAVGWLDVCCCCLVYLWGHLDINGHSQWEQWPKYQLNTLLSTTFRQFSKTFRISNAILFTVQSIEFAEWLKEKKQYKNR